MPLPNTGLAHPRMTAGLGLIYPATAQLYIHSPGQNSFGEPSDLRLPVLDDEGEPVTYRAYVEPSAMTQEIKRADSTPVISGFNIALQGYYPEITQAHSLLIDTVFYDVIGIGSDSTHSVTFITAERINPNG